MSARQAFRPVLHSLPRCANHSSRQLIARGFVTSAGSSSSRAPLYGALGGLAAAGIGYYFFASSDYSQQEGYKALKSPSKLDYQKVYDDVAELLESETYDDGSYGPVLVRLAWHASGTFDKDAHNGGSSGATMRFAPEANHGANAGLEKARERLEPIYKKYANVGLTYSDLWTLAGVCAIQEMGGPKVPWRPGRRDGQAEHCPPDGRLPDGDKGQDHIRKIFYRMGFNDQEIVALSGAHALGRCHADRSGFEGPWTFSPTTFTNDYFRLLFDEKWQPKKWNGPLQFEDKSTKSLMMLSTDMALVKDRSFKQYAKMYADDADAFFHDFSKAFAKLIELGVPSECFGETEPMLLRKTGEK